MMSHRSIVRVLLSAVVCAGIARTAAADGKMSSPRPRSSSGSSSTPKTHSMPPGSSSGLFQPSAPTGHGQLPPVIIQRQTPPVYYPQGPTYVPQGNYVPPGSVVPPTNALPPANELPTDVLPPVTNQIPDPVPPTNQLPGGLPAADPATAAQLCDQLGETVARDGQDLAQDPVGKLGDPELDKAYENLLSTYLGGAPGNPRGPAVAASVADFKNLIDQKVAAGVVTPEQRDSLAGKLDRVAKSVAAQDAACAAAPGGSGGGDPAPTPMPPAGGTGTPPPAPPAPDDPPTIIIDIAIDAGPIIEIFDPGIDDGVTLALNPGVVIIGTGGDGELTVQSGTPSDIGVPVMDGTPVPASQAAAAGCGVTLKNPKSSRGKINYTLDGESFAMEPGYAQQLPGGRPYLVEFDKGGSFGRTRYTLEQGLYEFSVGTQGWDLFSKVYKATLDNSGNTRDFHYVRAGQAATVAARQKQTLTDTCPIVIVFDQANGGEPARRELKDGVYRVAVDPRQRRLDLFRGDEQALVSTAPRPAATAEVAPPSPQAR